MIKHELEVVAQRFSLTKLQTIETIIHEIYVRGLNSEKISNIRSAYHLIGAFLISSWGIP